MISNMDIQGRVKVETFDEGGILDIKEHTNFVVRRGRSNLLSILNGKLSYDNSYIVMDILPDTLPLVTPGTLRIEYPAIGLEYNGVHYMFYIGIERDVDGNPIGSDSITYDVYSLASKLNELFNTITSKNVYSKFGGGTVVGVSSAGYGLFEASIVLRDNGEPTIKIKASSNAPGILLSNYSYLEGFPAFEERVYTLNGFFGPDTLYYQNVSSISCNNYIISSIQLGTVNVPATINSDAFPASTYTSPSYPVTALDIVDPLYPDRVTSCNYISVIPKVEANGESGTGVTFTEAALKHANGEWFAHVNLGQQYKNNTFGLRLTWTLNLIPR